MQVQILCDNPRSWMIPYLPELREIITGLGADAIIREAASEVVAGDILIMLSCEKIFKNLNLNKHNLVVHESALPQGKGWSPLTWQVLEGAAEIPVTLFEATEEVDSGVIYGQELIKLNGTELVDELRAKQAAATFSLIRNFVSAYPAVEGKPQQGETTFYKKRKPEDGALDVQKSIAEQFDLLRISDNERYPAFFMWKGEKYILKVYKA